MTAYEIVTIRDNRGVNRNIRLVGVTETASTVMGLEVTKEGELVSGKGFDRRRHIIDKAIIVKRTPLTLSRKYGILQTKRKD